MVLGGPGGRFDGTSEGLGCGVRHLPDLIRARGVFFRWNSVIRCGKLQLLGFRMYDFVPLHDLQHKFHFKYV